jgi:MinD superfamily P-loop ATPase
MVGEKAAVHPGREAIPEPRSAGRAEPTSVPKQLVVLSGKGGTGKTTVTAALGSMARRKVLADCDVDAPDLHLLLDLVPVSREVFRAGKEARIITERCCRCGLCTDYCRFDAIRATANGDGEKPLYVVDPVSCEGCGLCALVCTSKAVDMIEPERGHWMVSDTRLGPLVHARLAIGGENSGKLVTLVREQALTLARERHLDLVIVDGPPGVGCPVIASVAGADLVLAVTEPTVSGVHDLERLVTLVRTFKVPLAVCINKCDLNREMTTQIERLCAASEIEIVGRIAYDTTAVEAQVEARSIIEYNAGPMVDQLRAMWAGIENKLNIIVEE